MKLNVKTWKIAQLIDLILVSVLGLFVWNGQTGEGFLLCSFVLFRLSVSLGLDERKKSNWLPVSLFSIWLLSGSFVGGFSKFLLEQPSFDMAKTAMLLLGDTGIDRSSEYSELLVDERRIPENLFVCLFFLLFWGWMLLYPIITYVRQWRKRQFVDTVVLGCSKWTWGLLLLTAGIWVVSLFMSSYADVAVIAYLYPCAVAWAWMISYLKQMRLSKWKFKIYVGYVVLFFGAYLIGRETEHFLSLFGLLVVPFLFYKKLSVQQTLPVGKKDILFLVAAGYLFWKCQFFEDIFRIFLLGGGLVIVAILSWKRYRVSASKSLSFFMFLMLGFVIPLLCIGYNPYAVVDARRLGKFDAYQYSNNGIVQIADGDRKGLRDRFTEILPCKYDQIELAGDPHLPYLKVKKGDVWGVYNIETQKMVVSPNFASIYQYDNNFLKLKLQDGNTCYYPIGLDSRSGNDSLLTRFVAFPCPEFIEENSYLYYSILQESPIDNAPIYSGIYRHLVSAGNELMIQHAAPKDFWEWAEKSTRLVERLDNEYNLFMSDTASVAHQSVERVYELLCQNGGGSQAEMNELSLVYAVLDLYRTLDLNQTLVELFKEDADVAESMKQEYARWMDYYWSAYRFYSNCVIGNDCYSALPLDLNGFLESKAEWRRNILAEELSLFKTGELTDEVQKNIGAGWLEKSIHLMEGGSAEPEYLQNLQQSVLLWMEQRERVSSLLPPSYRDSYDILTQKVKWMIAGDLKWLADEHKGYEDALHFLED